MQSRLAGDGKFCIENPSQEAGAALRNLDPQPSWQSNASTQQALSLQWHKTTTQIILASMHHCIWPLRVDTRVQVVYAGGTMPFLEWALKRCHLLAPLLFRSHKH